VIHFHHYLSLVNKSCSMSPIELRDRVHSLIDAVKSEELLQRIHDLLAGSGEGMGSGVWASMTEAQRERVLVAYASSLDPSKLSSTEEVMKRRKG
jgi:hypothetical protein